MADYSVDQLFAKLERADAAGDSEAAKVIADEIRRVQGGANFSDVRSQVSSTEKPEQLVMPDGTPASVAFERKRMQVEDERMANPTRGFVDNTLAGVGKFIVDWGRGAQQVMGGRTAEQVEEDRRLDAPLMRTGGGVLGNMGGQLAAMSIPVKIPGMGAVPSAARPFVDAGVRAGAFRATQPMGVGENRALTAAQDAALGIAGQGVATGTRALASGAASRVDDATRALAAKAEKAGIRVGLPQLSQNPMTRTVASQMERLPFSGGRSRANANQEAFNEAVGRTFGAEGKKITPEVFAKAKTKLSDQFDALTDRNSLRVTPQLTDDLAQINAEASRLTTSDTARLVRNWTDEILAKADETGIVPGRAYQNFDSKLGKVLKKDGDQYLGALRDRVRAAMDESMASSRDSALWAQTRKQWAAMKTVEDLVGKSPTGDVSPALLMGRVTADKAGKSRMATGRGGELGDLARIGQRFLKEAPNSGTADRMLVNLGIGGSLFGAQQTGLIDPQTALAGAGLLLGNRVANKALNSRALAFGDSASLNGLARLASPAPRLLPASYRAGLLGLALPEEEDASLLGY